MSGLDPDVIRHALKTAQRNGFRFVRLKVGDQTFRAVLEEDADHEDSPTLAVAELGDLTPVDEYSEIKAPCVGYFQFAKSPLSPDQNVAKGDVVGVISALGIENDVVAPKAGVVVEILVNQGEAVQFGQPIARVKVAP